MTPSAARLRDKLDRIGQVKRTSLAEDTRRFLELDPGDRLAETLRHCDAHLEAFGLDSSTSPRESEVEVWASMRRLLAGRA